jgi:hypothetical protein
MEEIEKTSQHFMQTYCYTKFGDFLVSTIYRRSSAALNWESWYYETLCWKKDDDEWMGKLFADNSGASNDRGAIKQHNELVEQLYKNGKFNNELNS